MAIRTYQTPVGTDLVSLAGAGWFIGGIQVDNPTGSWLRVTGIEQLVPPYRKGWTYPVSPQQSSISVLFVDSPSGSASVLVGSPVTVIVSDTPYPASEGFTTGAGGRVTTIPPSQTTFVDLIADLPALVVPSIAITATSPIIIRKLAATYDLRDIGGPTPGYDPRAVVNILWEAMLPPSWAWQQGMAPETPYVSDTFLDGSLILPASSVLQVAAMVQLSGAEYALGASDIQIMAMVEYYQEVNIP